MGGNAIIKGDAADRIKFFPMERQNEVNHYVKLVHSILKYIEQTDEDNWRAREYYRDAFAGSFDQVRRFEFNKLIEVGDIDFQIDKTLALEFCAKIEEIEISKQRFEKYYLVGTIRSSTQLITLWHSPDRGERIQIDFEFVEFVDGKPSEFAQWAHGSDYKDMNRGVKAVFHKYMVRAMTALTVKEIKTKNGLEKTNEYAFSVDYGLRRKFRYCEFNDYEVKLPPNESMYFRDIKRIFETIIPDYTYSNTVCHSSFIGLCHVVANLSEFNDIVAVYEGFVLIIFSKGSQKLYRDKDSDRNAKLLALSVFEQTICSIIDDEYIIKLNESALVARSMANEYYGINPNT